MSQQNPEVSLPKDLLGGFSLTPWWVRVVPSGAHSTYVPGTPDSGPSFFREALEPHGWQEDTLAPFWRLLPAANSQSRVRPGCEENQERSRKV